MALLRRTTRMLNRICYCKEDKDDNRIKCQTKNIEDCPGRGFFHENCIKEDVVDKANYTCPVCSESTTSEDTDASASSIDDESSDSDQELQFNEDHGEGSIFSQNSNDREEARNEPSIDDFKIKIEIIISLQET